MGITSRRADFQEYTFSGIASGSSATLDVPVPTDEALYLDATVIMVNASSSHLGGSAGLRATYFVANKNGTVAAPAVLTGGVNPANSNTTGLLGAEAEGSDINSGGGTNPTAIWTVSGTNARLTVTNQYSSSVDIVVWVSLRSAKNV